mgnify:CR=1 FL=1
MLLLLLLSVLQIFGSANDDIVKQSKAQAKFYISNIQQEKQLDENLWALTLLTSEHPEVQNFVEGEVQNKKYTGTILSQFRNIEASFNSQLEKVVFTSGSSDLLVALILEKETQKERRATYQRFQSIFDYSPSGSIDYHALCEKIIESKKVGPSELPVNSFQLPHFFILFEYSDFLVDKYLPTIVQKWEPNPSSTQDVHKTLANASLLRVLYLESNYSKIRPLYSTLLENKLIPNSSIKLRIYRYLDYSMYRLGYYDRSLKIVRNFTLPISDYLNKKATNLQLKQLQGVYLYSIGKIKAAETIYQEVLTSVDKKNPEVRLSSLYNNLALTYDKLGKYDEYLNLQFQALRIAKRDKNYSHQIEIYRNLFIYYRRNNNKEDAFRYLEEAQFLAEKRGNARDLGSIYISLGTTYRKFDNNFKKAHTYFDKAEKVLDPNNNSENYIYLLVERAFSYEQQKEYAKALEVYDQILTVTPKGNPNYLDALVNEASVNLKMGNIEKAEKIIAKFKSFKLNKLEFQQLVKAKATEANYLSKTTSPNQALDILNPALEQVVVRAKSSADLESGFWHIEDEYLDAFELAVSIYQDIGKPEMAIQKLDQLKTINDASLYQNPLVKSSLLNESELTQYKKLTDQLDVTRKKLLTASESEKFEIRQQISQLKLKKRKLDKKLTKNIDTNPISIRQIQNQLSAHELAMHITELKDKYYIAHISRSNVHMKSIALDSTKRKLLSGAVQQVATHKTNLDSLYKVTQMLGLKDIPSRIEQVTLIPDSYFYQLPIDILPLEEPTHGYSYGQAKYVIEEFRTQYLTSLEDFQNPRKKVSTNNPLSYVGYGVSNFSGYQKKSLVPLPYAQTEINNIASRLGNLSDIQTFVNEQSTKSRFTQTAPKANIIHLATHSEVSLNDPMFSSVYMSKTSSSADTSTFDDRIFAYELFELNLNNEMIMLNSCESGSGSYIQGTGVMGFSRALQYAGAKSLILNLWSVNDMLASDFATHFYDELNQGKNKAEALRATKQYFLRNKNASPHFWGPYMLIGDAQPIVQPNKDKNLAMAGAFVFYFLLMIGLSILTQKGLIFRNRE